MSVTISRRRAWPAILAILALVVGLTPTLTLAAPPKAETETLAPVMVVLDASGSMNEPDPSGGSKMEAAKAALKTVISDLPKKAKIGLTVYGSKVDANSPGTCEDIETVTEVGPINADQLTATVDGITALGSTPIGNALRHGNAELPTEGPRSMILISDGIDTCAPPAPCDVAAELATQGVELTMHTVGFDVDDAAREQLRCIADVGRGQYVDVTDATTLSDQLPMVTESALRGYQAMGIPVTGTAATDDAPELQPGQYLDKIDNSTTRYYEVPVPEGMTIYAAATVIRPASEGDGGTDATYVDLALQNSQGDKCVDNRTISSDMVWEAHNTVAIDAQLDKRNDCYRKDETYFLRIERGESENSFGERDVEIMVAFEPPVKTKPKAGQDGHATFNEPQSPAQQVAGGGSFNDATELTASGRYSDRLHFGEMLVYKVPLTWGQGLAYQVDVGNYATTDVAANIETALYNPVRQGGLLKASSSAVYTGEARTLDAVKTPYVGYRNREGSNDVALASLAGYYYLTVRVSFSTKAESGTIPVELNLAISGEPTDAPEYQAIGDFPGELLYGIEREDSDDTSDRAKSGNDEESNVALIATLAAAGALAAAVATFLFLRIRRRSTSG